MKEHVAVRKMALKRDDYTCQFCGFKAMKFQEAHHLDDNHNNNTIENIVTACPLCHLCHHVGFAGIKSTGRLIKLDGISQAQLNSLVRTLWVGSQSKSPTAFSSCNTILERLNACSSNAKKVLGTTCPGVLGEFLLSIDDETYASRDKHQQGILLLPLKNGFQKQIEYWSKTSFKSTKPETWTRLAVSKLKSYNI